MPLAKGSLLLITVLIIAFICFAPPAFGAQQAVRIVAGKAGSYDLESQVFTAEGSVEVHVDGVILYGDLLRADLAEGLVTLQGSVRLLQDDQEIWGESLIYNLETGEGTFDKVRAEISVPDGTIFVSGRSVLFDADKYVLSESAFTTCDLEKSHYRLVTKELEFIPGEKVVIRHVVFYEGSIPLFYWPYLVIPLRSDLEDLLVSLPVVGFSDHEGYYIKSTFNYYRSADSYGNLYLDLYTRLGIGLGARHYYRLGELGQGSLYVWGIPTSSEPAYKGAWEHSLTKEHWSLTTKNSLEKTWVKEQVSSETRLDFGTADQKGKVWLTHKENPAATTKEQSDVGLEWSKDLTERLTLNLRGNYAQKRTSEEVRIMDYLVSTVYKQGKHKLTLTVEQRFNPDLLSSGSKEWRSVQRLPELTWEQSDLGLKGLSLSSQIVLGRYEETPSMVTQGRAYAQLTLGSQTWRPRTGTSLSYQGDLNGALYSDQEAQAWLYGRVVLNQSLGKNLSLSGTYRRRDVWGSSPFKFDAQKPLQDLSLRLSYNRGKLQTSANTTYDFLTKRFGTLTLSGSMRPSERWHFNLYASYDLNSQSWIRVVPLAEYSNEAFQIKLGARYKPANRELERVDLRIGLPVGSTWKVSYDSIYEPVSQKFSKGEISISKDLHCRQFVFSYDHVDNRFAVQLTINAFPTLPIGWDSEGGLSLFDLEDVAEIIGTKE